MIKGRHTRGDLSLRLVPVTSPPTSLHEGAGRRDLFQEQFTQSVLRNKSQGFVPKIQTDLNFEAKMVMISLHDGT